LEFSNIFLIFISINSKIGTKNQIAAAASSNSNYKKKKYRFSYSVKDDLNGDDYSHTQKQGSDGAVRGSYKVQLPDGRVQIVRYVADDQGYKADVLYEKNGVIVDESDQIVPQRTVIEPRRQQRPKNVNRRVYQPRPNLYPKNVENVEVNNYNEINPRVQPNQNLYYQPAAIPVPFSYFQKTAVASTAAPVFFITTPQPRYNYQDIHIQPTPQPLYYHHPSHFVASTTPLPPISNRKA
jgi:hypothetical protein